MRHPRKLDSFSIPVRSKIGLLCLLQYNVITRETTETSRAGITTEQVESKTEKDTSNKNGKGDKDKKVNLDKIYHNRNSDRKYGWEHNFW